MTILNKFKEPLTGSRLATVIEVVTGKGVKIKVDGESSPRETYYNSLVIPNVDDRVYFIEISGTILIQGSLKF